MTATQRLPGEARFKDGMARTGLSFMCRVQAAESTPADAMTWNSGLNRGGDL